jgi:ABC-2 type transport system permease protein
MIAEVRTFVNEWFIDSNRVERIWHMAKMDFKVSYFDSVFGLMWALAKPLYRMALYWVVFQVLLDGRKSENYGVFLFLGMLVFHFFTDGISSNMKILSNKRYLFESTDMMPIEAYLATMASEGIGFAFNMFALLVVGFILEAVQVNFYYFYLIPVFLSLAIMTLGASFILSTMFMFFHDIQQFWNIFAQALFFLYPVLYRGGLFDKMPILNYINPAAGFVINVRLIMLEGLEPNLSLMLYNICCSLIVLFIGIYVLDKYSKRASELL